MDSLVLNFKLSMSAVGFFCAVPSQQLYLKGTKVREAACDWGVDFDLFSFYARHQYVRGMLYLLIQTGSYQKARSSFWKESYASLNRCLLFSFQGARPFAFLAFACCQKTNALFIFVRERNHGFAHITPPIFKSAGPVCAPSQVSSFICKVPMFEKQPADLVFDFDLFFSSTQSVCQRKALLVNIDRQLAEGAPLYLRAITLRVARRSFQ